MGSSSSFNAFAKLGYHHSKIHQSIPVEEAFYNLCQFIQQSYGIHNLDKEVLIRETLKHLTTNSSSLIFRELQDLLLPEFIKLNDKV